MYKTMMAGVSAAALVFGATTAQAGSDGYGMSDGWYVSLFGGASILSDFSFDYDYGGADASVDMDTKTGFVVGLTAGKKLSKNFRADVEVAYSKNKAKSFDFDGFGSYDVNGDIESVTALANVWYDIGTGSAITPYVGGGGGLGIVWSDVRYSGGGGNAIDGTDMGFAFQAGAGVNYALSPAMDLTVGYRFKGILGLSLESDFPLSSNKKGDLYGHNVFAGVVWKFSGP